MAAIPAPMHGTVQSIYKAYEQANREEHRPHLGASIIGKPCERRLWYTFRWAEKKSFEGRMLRLFETGHLAEPRFIDNLRAIGATVETHAPDGNQFRVSHLGNHIGGSMDSAILGLVEAPKTWHVGEFKTHSQKSFDKLIKEGVKKAKREHWVQMQIYMGKTGMTRALYLAVNKNTDELYAERVEFDQVEYQREMNKAERVVRAAEPPLRISQDPSYFECKYCDFTAICHGDQVPEVNCRTCANSTPVVDESRAGDDQGGCWQCDAFKAEIPLEAQRVGCDGHRYIPILLEKTARPIDFRDGAVIYETPEGGSFANGDGTGGTFSSQEIRTCGGKAVLQDMAAIKAQFATARVVG